MNLNEPHISQQLLEYRGLQIGVSCQEPSDLEWLNEFLMPWFACGSGVPNIHVELLFNQAQFEQVMSHGLTPRLVNAYIQDTDIIQFPEVATPGPEKVFLDVQNQLAIIIKGNGITLLGPRHDVLGRKTMMKVVRENAMSHVHASGGRFLHASSCELEGHGLAMAGQRNAGKTSMLLYLLLNSGCRFVTGDRLMVDGCTAIGLPTIVSIRNGTLELFPEFAREVNKRGFGLPLTVAECARDQRRSESFKKPHKASLSSRQFCEIAGKAAVARTALQGLIFPRVDSSLKGWSMKPLEPEEVRHRLGGALFGNIHPNNLSEVFNVAEVEPMRQRIVSDSELCQQISETLSGCEVVLGSGAFDSPDLAMAISEWVVKGD